MEHMIEHETLPLKEEKNLIREIKQLKQLRDQLSSNIGSCDEVQQALDNRDQIEESLKVTLKFYSICCTLHLPQESFSEFSCFFIH